MYKEKNTEKNLETRKVVIFNQGTKNFWKKSTKTISSSLSN